MNRKEATSLRLIRFESDVKCIICGNYERYVSSNRCYACAVRAWKRTSKKREISVKKQVHAIIFRLNDEFKSITEIIDALTWQGYRNKHNNPFTSVAVKKILTNANKTINKPVIYEPKERCHVELVKANPADECKFNFKPDDLGDAARW